MKNLSDHLFGVAILSVFLAISVGVAFAINTQFSVGTDITKIISINYLGADQWVEITNEGTGSINLTNWTLMNMENQTFPIPANFILKAGSVVKVHPGKGNNTATDLYNSALIWNRNGDNAILNDATGKTVSEYRYPIKVSGLRNVTKITPSFLANMLPVGGTSPIFQPGYRSDYSVKRASSKSNLPANLTGHPFICHGGPLNWAWTTGLR